MYKTGFANYRVSAGSFFQTNRFLTDELTRLVTTGRKSCVTVDFYAGVGLFTLPLAKTFEKVIAVESAPASFADLQHNAPTNVDAHCVTSETFLAKLPPALKNADYVVVDPPRAGLGDKVAKLLAKVGAPQIAYVSCDPATLARDLKILISSGYRIEAVHLVDLFPQTFHIECAAFLAR